MLNETELTELKAQCWDIVYPALIFYNATGFFPSGEKDLKRAIKHYNETETENYKPN